MSGRAHGRFKRDFLADGEVVFSGSIDDVDGLVTFKASIVHRQRRAAAAVKAGVPVGGAAVAVRFGTQFCRRRC